MKDFLSFFNNLSLVWIGLAITFGLVWLAALGAWQWRGKWLWLALAGVAIFPISVAWVQVPLANLVSNWFIHRYGLGAYQNRVFLTRIPVVLLGGLVLAGAKLFPIVVYWLGRNRKVNPKIGLAIGAMVGAGFGVFEAQWVLNKVLAFGFNLSWVTKYGFLGILPLWDTFFAVAFDLATAALLGYGLAKGKGWQFYLLVSCLQFLADYSTLLFSMGKVTIVQMEIIIAVFSVMIFGVVLWLMWRKIEEIKPGLGQNEAVYITG
jgi:RsiW-degrading membrane proteinase PrsW (M82 family)